MITRKNDLKYKKKYLQIKKQYKKMAMKYHPDRNKENKDVAEKIFKEISNAYNVLTDPQKKYI